MDHALDYNSRTSPKPTTRPHLWLELYNYAHLWSPPQFFHLFKSIPHVCTLQMVGRGSVKAALYHSISPSCELILLSCLHHASLFEIQGNYLYLKCGLWGAWALGPKFYFQNENIDCWKISGSGIHFFGLSKVESKDCRQACWTNSKVVIVCRKKLISVQT
jgi:hypothetical protein